MSKLKNQDNKGKKVFVAMSGGVDSSVVAALMKEQGYDVVGVTMCFSIVHPDSKKPSCCGADGIADAQRVARVLDIPHYVLDFAKDINEHVIDDFTKEYLDGRTPNPCVRCNQYLKFGTLYQKVMAMGADFLATGHYAKIECDSDLGGYQMKKAQDPKKDQSYFLYSINKETLPKILFPLGGMVKSEVRDLAQKYQLSVAQKRESQDICFVPDTGYKDFIRERLGDSVFEPGDFKNHKGEVVGQHQGILNYTIGQRDKLGIALGVPVYVYKIDKQTNTVYVGPQECLYANGLTAAQFNPVSMDAQFETMEVYARIRYNAREIKGFLTYLGEGKVRVEFAEPQKSVTPGQSVVFYQGDVVLGGAVICEAL
jgi:tRNA-specific 2-thiouridylase